MAWISSQNGEGVCWQATIKKTQPRSQRPYKVLLRIMHLGRGGNRCWVPLIWLGNSGVLDKWSFLAGGRTWRFDFNYKSLLSGFFSHRHSTVKLPLTVTSPQWPLSSFSKVAIEERFNFIFSWILLITIRNKFFLCFHWPRAHHVTCK